eukprot:Gb_29962 [translate_table: standard]
MEPTRYRSIGIRRQQMLELFGLFMLGSDSPTNQLSLVPSKDCNNRVLLTYALVPKVWPLRSLSSLEEESVFSPLLTWQLLAVLAFQFINTYVITAIDSNPYTVSPLSFMHSDFSNHSAALWEDQDYSISA